MTPDLFIPKHPSPSPLWHTITPRHVARQPWAPQILAYLYQARVGTNSGTLLTFLWMVQLLVYPDTPLSGGGNNISIMILYRWVCFCRCHGSSWYPAPCLKGLVAFGGLLWGYRHLPPPPNSFEEYPNTPLWVGGGKWRQYGWVCEISSQVLLDNPHPALVFGSEPIN